MVAYRLALPAHARIHPVFHVPVLKKFEGSETTGSYFPLPLQTSPEGPISSPVRVLQARQILWGDDHVDQHLVVWDNLVVQTWEDVQVLANLYPQLDLEVKDPLHGEANVMIASPNTGPGILRRSNRERRHT